MVNLEVLKTISLDLSERENTPIVHAVRGEKNSRKIRFDLFNGGVQWEIDQNASVLISYKKADGHGGVYDVLDNGEKAFEFAYGSTNSVIITLAEQVLTTVGAVSLLVSFVLDDEILSTFNIVLDVSENPGIGVTESEDYFSLSAAIDAAKKAVGEMLDSNDFASKEYVDGVVGDLREDLDEIADDARVFYVTISKSDNDSFVADKSVAVIRSAYDNGRTVKAVVDDDGEQVTIPLISIIEGDTMLYIGYGAYSNRIVISQTDILVSVHNDELPNVKTVNGTAPDANGNVELDTQSGAIPAPETAEVGQTIVVKEVDENGKPTAWEAADFPSGGSVSKWVEAVNMVTAEDVRELVVNKDKNGNSFSFDEIHCSIQFVGTDANTKQDAVEYRTLQGYNANPARGPALPLIYAQRLQGNIAHHIHSLITPSGFGIHDSYRADTLAQIRAMSGSFTVKPITGIRLWAYSEYIAKGTTIVIYGRNRESEV